MKAMSLKVVGVLAACLTGAVVLTSPAMAQSRHGVIEEIQPIENRGDDTSERKRQGRTWGERIGKFGGVATGIGLTRAGHTEAGLAVTGTAAIAGDKIGGAVGERIAGEGPATRYMLKVRLDEGRVLTLTQLREQVDGMGVGTRVMVVGSGDEATLQTIQ